jgi:hypothetical protein
LFPDQWKKEHSNYLDYALASKEPITTRVVQTQGQAVVCWEGSCDKLGNITKPTLVIVWIEDNVTPGTIL